VFRSGQAAFLQTGSWFAAELQNQPADFTVGVIPFPRLADAEHTGDITGAVTHVFGISSKSAHQEAARAFLEHLLTEQSTTTWAERGLPSLVVGAVAEHGPQEIKTIFQAVLDAEASLPWLENELPPGVGEDRIYNGTAALVAGRMAPADFVASVQAGLEAR
jgi:ABC-type glycerol-3-phosphate transport system substrate-binding protein